MRNNLVKNKKMRKKIIAGVMSVTVAMAMGTSMLAPMENVFASTSTSMNNTFDTAEELAFNTTIEEELTDTDNVRYYKFTLDGAGELNINASGNGDSKNFKIYDENRTEVYECGCGWGTPNMTTGSVYLTGGTYYLKLESNGYVTFTATKDSLMETLTETQTENNDSFEDAYVISTSKQYKGVLTYNDIEDYYKFELPTTGTVNVNITNVVESNATITAIATIYDDSNTLVYSRGCQNGETINEDVVLSSGTYYFEMIRNNTSGKGKGCYSFKLDYRMSSPAISSVTNSGKKKMTIKWGEVDGADGYELQYSKNKNFKSGVIKKTLKSTATKASYRKLSKNKTYYVRMRSYVKVNGQKKYSGWSSKKSVVIKK